MRVKIYEKEIQITRKRPMLVGFCKRTGVRFDLTINTPEPVRYSRLIKAALRHEFLKKMIILIKYWSQVQGICKASKGTLPSIGYTFICIWFLQKLNILPKFIYEDQDLLQMDHISHTPPMAHLLELFFDYFSHRQNFKQSVMSLREESVSLKSLGWDQPGQHYFPIQDPFDPTRDVGRAVNTKGLKMMMRACFIAKTKLLNGHDPAELFVQYPQVQRAQEPDKM